MRNLGVTLALAILIGGLTICNASNNDSTVYYLVDNLEVDDSTSFKKIVDTLAYFAGRNTDKALNLSPVVVQKVEELGNPNFRIKTYLQVAQLYLLQGKTDSSQLFLDRCFPLVKSELDSMSLYSCLYLQGWLYSNMNQIEKARETYYAALDLAGKMDKECMTINVLSILALSYKKDLQMQIKLLRKAINIGKSSDKCSSSGYQTALYNLAGAYQQTGKQDSAIIIYKELREIYSETNYLSGIAGIANNEAHLYLEKKDYKKALESAFEAYRCDSITGSRIYLISDLLTIGKIYKEMDQLEKSTHYLQIADSLSLASKTFNKRLEITKFIADNFAMLNQYNKAYNALQVHIDARDSLNELEMNKKIKEIEEAYKLKEKEKENLALKSINEKDQQIIEQQNLIIWLLVLTLLVIVAMLFYFILNRKRIKNLMVKLTDSNVKLTTSNQTKNKMLSIVSHDLRGPIGNLHQLLKFVIEEDENLSVESIMEYLYVTERNLGTINNLLNNLLYWANNQIHSFDPQLEAVDICPFVLEANAIFTFISKNKNIEIQSELEDCDQVKTDKEMLAFIHRNIVSNALKFTPKNGSISIKGQHLSGHYQLNISDTGIGMDKEQLNALFSSGINKSRKGTNDEPGTGIGMLMVKEFADKCNINIQVESEINKGTTFVLNIPLSQKNKG